MRTATDAGAPTRIIETVVAVNDARKKAMADKVIKVMGGDVRGKTIAILGLTFKPNTDDMRDAPSLDIIPALQSAGARIVAYDPEGRHEAEKLLSDIQYADGPYEALTGADGAVIITEWDQFRALDLDRVKAALKSAVLVDLRNIYGAADMKARGFTYVGIGR